MENTSPTFEQLIENWQSSVVHFLPKLFLAIIVILLFVILARIAKRFTLNFYLKTIKVHVDFATIISSVVYFFFILSGVFLALEILGLEQVLTHLLTGAGIVGIIAGFAFKDIASNIFAGLLLQMQHPFKIGDWVTINNNYGLVTETGWITTKLITEPGQEVFVPNQLIFNSSFTNFSALQKRRIILKSGISIKTDLGHVKTIALDEVMKIEELLITETVEFYFTEMNNTTINFELLFWITFNTNGDYQKAMNDAIMSIKKRFEQENIALA